jgi:hypothetical protein
VGLRGEERGCGRGGGQAAAPPDPLGCPSPVQREGKQEWGVGRGEAETDAGVGAERGAPGEE